MQALILSDTHWELNKYINEINFSNIDLIIFLWDNYTEDFELLKNINIKKIGILWNHPPYENTKEKIDIFEKYWIENISWKKFEYKKVSFFWIPWETKNILLESMKNKIPTDFVDKIQIFQNTKVDIIISHFPAFWIMDSKNLSHRWLIFLKDYILKYSPKYLFHWHLHKQEKQKYLQTDIIQVYPYLIINL